jgi:hypothetical protein
MGGAYRKRKSTRALVGPELFRRRPLQKVAFYGLVFSTFEFFSYFLGRSAEASYGEYVGALLIFGANFTGVVVAHVVASRKL